MRAVKPSCAPVSSLTRQSAAARVKSLRLALGESQEALAIRKGVGERTLRDIESGRVRMTALELVIELEQELAARVAKKAA